MAEDSQNLMKQFFGMVKVKITFSMRTRNLQGLNMGNISKRLYGKTKMDAGITPVDE